MEVREVMKKPISLSPDTSLAEVMRFMSKKRLREVLLADKNGQLMGMVILHSIVDIGAVERTKISTLAFVPPTVKPDSSLEEAIRKMLEMGIETIPVVKGLQLVGIVTSDVALSAIQLTGEVREVMVDAITINIDDSVAKARAVMKINNINRLPVLEKGKLVGIVTSSDILRRVFLSKNKKIDDQEFIKGMKNLQKSVKEIMSPHPITVNPSTHLKDTASMMLEYDLRALPVARGHKIAGIICRKDVLRYATPKAAGVDIFLKGWQDEPEDIGLEVKRLAIDQVKNITHSGDFDRVEIILKRQSKSAYQVMIEAGKHKVKSTGKEPIGAAENAFDQLKEKLKK